MIGLRSLRQRRLVAALVLAGGRVTSADSLAEAVWGDALPADPSGALQNLVSRVRSSLAPAGAAIETTTGGYRLAVEIVAVDAMAFEQDIREARALEATPRADRLSAAVSMWRGHPYDDLDTETARAEATRLTELRLAAEEDAGAAMVEAGQLEAAFALLEPFCAREPLRERPRLVLARALAGAGRRAEALRALEDLRRILLTELGIEPSAAVSAMTNRILAGELPAPARLPVSSTPRVITATFGREDDLASARQLLADARLVTFVGPGGVGKTTLALLVAGSVGPKYEYGCHFIDLSMVSDHALVANAFGRGLGISVGDPAELTDRLIAAFAHRHTLLVIDNAEQVVASVATIVATLLSQTDAVDVLVTSREPLNIRGERLCPVEPFSELDLVGPATQLFCDRATAVRPGWRPTSDELRTIVDICRALDGLPLAIELAAAHLRSRSVGEILVALAFPLDLLARRGGATARHGGLRAMVDWSYDLLAPLEAALFDRLSVFTGGFTREAAIDIGGDLGDGSELDAAVDVLVDRSMLRVADRPWGTRYSMLEPVRQYALAHLGERGDESGARERHAGVVLDLVERADAGIGGPDESMWVARLDDERANIVTACRWLAVQDHMAAVRLVRAVYFAAFPRGWTDLLGLPEAVLSSVNPSPGHRRDPEIGVLCGIAADRALAAGDLARARELVDLGFDAAEAADGSDRYCHGAAGDLALFTGATETAAVHYQASASGFRSVGDHALAAWLSALGVLPLVHGGDRDAARTAATDALSAADATGCPSARAFAHYALAEACASHDDTAGRTHLDEAVRLADSVSATYIAGLAHLSLATLETRAGHAPAALPHYAELLDMWRRSGNWAQQWNTMRTLVVVLAGLDWYDEAVRLLAGIDAHAELGSWGDDHERLAGVVDSAKRAIGLEQFELCRLRGSLASSADVLVLAQEAVDRALSSA